MEATVRPGDLVARVEALRFTYGDGPAPALRGVDLEVRAGELTVIEGPSGGGKSTLLRALAGLVPHFHGGSIGGRALVMGEEVTAGRRGAAGAAGMVFQDPEAQAVMGTVDRDVAFGPENAGLPADAIARDVAWALAAAGATHLIARRIDMLSSGERQRVAIAAVLARRPALLLLDEPTSQLDAATADALVATLRELADRAGVAVVVAEHRVERLRPVADRVLTLADGRLREGPAAAPEETAPPLPAEGGGWAARLEAVTAGFGGCEVLRDATLALAAGTVTALVGPNGSGKSTLLRVLAGLHPADAGRVVVGGRDVTALPAEHRFPTIGLVPQDPGRHLLSERVDDEVALALRGAGRGAAEAGARVAATMEALEIAGLADRHPVDLSVGERERVALAAIMVADPSVLVLDEPTRGMDPVRKRLLAGLLRDRAAAGAAVLVATHDEAFARAAADARAEMREGRVVPVARAARPAGRLG